MNTVTCPRCGNEFDPSIRAHDGSGATETRDAVPALERRSLDVTEIRVQREEGKAPKVVGYAATFNQPSKPLTVMDKGGKPKKFVETIAPGAFTRALGDGRDIAGLVGHMPNQIVARTSGGMLTLSQDDKGLAFELTPSDTTRARDLLADIDHGNIRGMSFGFGDDTKDQWAKGDDGTPQRTLTDIDLREISFTPFPAYEGTSVGVRSLAGLEEMETRDHPGDYSAVAGATRSMASYCRSMAEQMMSCRDVMHAHSGDLSDTEQKHVRDLHDAMREMNKRMAEVRDWTRSKLADAPDDGDGDEGEDDPAATNRAMKIQMHLREAVRVGQLTVDEVRAMNPTK